MIRPIVRPATIGAPRAWHHTVAGPVPGDVKDTIAVMQAGVEMLDPASRARMQAAASQISAPAYQAQIAALPDVQNKTPKGIELITVLASLGVTFTNPFIVQTYADVLQAAAPAQQQAQRTTGAAPINPYNPSFTYRATTPVFGNGPNAAANMNAVAGGAGFPSAPTAGARPIFGQHGMAGVAPQGGMTAGARVSYGGQNLNAFRGF